MGNMEGAIAAGLDVGAYYFSNAITVAEAEEEAEAFLARLEPARLPARMMAKSMPSAATASQSMIPLWPDTSMPWAK